MLEVVLYALEMPEGMRRMRIHMLEVVEGELCSPDVMRCVLFCILDGELCFLKVLEVLAVSEVMRCALLCTLEAIRRVLLRLLEVLGVLRCWRYRR